MRSIRQFCARLTTCMMAGCLVLSLAAPALAAPDPAFTKWLDGLWPDVEKQGVSRKTFSSATHQLEPDLTLPDLEIPGRKTPAPSQAEFVQTPADYVRESNIARLAEQGKKLAADHRATLNAIAQKEGGPGTACVD